MKKYNFLSHLFAEPSVIEGVSRVFDLGNTMQEYNFSESEEAHIEAMKNDWKSVGNDLNYAIKNYERQEFTKPA